MLVFGVAMTSCAKEDTQTDDQFAISEGLEKGDVLLYEYFDGVIQGQDFHIFGKKDTMQMVVLDEVDSGYLIAESLKTKGSSFDQRFQSLEGHQFQYKLTVTEDKLKLQSVSTSNNKFVSPIWFTNECGNGVIEYGISENVVFAPVEDDRWWHWTFNRPAAGFYQIYPFEDAVFIDLHYNQRDCSLLDGPLVFNGYTSLGVPLISYQYVQDSGEIIGFRFIGVQ